VKDSGSQVVLCAPQLLPVVLEATSHWDKEDQAEKIVLACRRSEAEGNTSHKCLDELMGNDLLEPYQVKDPTEELAYLCYSSGTTGLAKGVMTTVYNMTR
jgi:acyl-CoA synthetase (AMP-forming)/AMP-acid ligase II